MSTETSSASRVHNHKEWVAKRIHSFVGIVPLGIYVILHLARNLTSLQGPEAFDNAILSTWSKPINYVWVVLLVYLPLIYHAGYGIKLTLSGEKTSIVKYPNFQNVRYLFQRLSALGMLGFLFAHIFLTRAHVSMGWLQDAATNPAGQVTYNYFATHFTDWSKGTAIVYALGILATVYHLANGVATFCISWGITTGAKAQRRAEYIALVFGLLTFAMGMAAIVGFFLHPFTEFVTPSGPMSPTGIIGQFLGH
jgi:succinate dehydrogenase / fumarate reductase cytochrome b subunit